MSTLESTLDAPFNIDFVVRYRFNSEEPESEATFQRLVCQLQSVGFSVEVRDGTGSSILVFVAISSDRLTAALYNSRIRDWLFGVAQEVPEKLDDKSHSLTNAERLRIVYLLITNPRDAGGAGISVGEGEWKGVDAIFPLHDQKFNKVWMTLWSTGYLLTADELKNLRDHLGEKIAIYFAFLQSYLLFLIIPSICGAFAYIFLPSFSILIMITNCLWSIFFVEYWTRQEIDLAVRWGVRGISSIQHPRPEFKPDSQTIDPITAAPIGVFPSYKRLSRQALQIPFAIVASIALGGVVAVCFIIEILISEVYEGPFKSVLVYLPTGLVVALQSPLTSLLTHYATKLTDYENYQTEDAYEAAVIQKTFLFTVITSYLPIYLTAFVYIPLGSHITSFVEALNRRLFSQQKATFEVDPARLTSEVIYFGIAGQVVNLMFEIVIPYLKLHYHRWMNTRNNNTKRSRVSTIDEPEEADFLKRVRNEADLDTYDVNDDLNEMCTQFGYLTTFSVVWPLIPLCFLLNNWIEVRSDATKICYEMRRPIPRRADSIGPWLNNLGFLTWLGSITTAALVFLYSGSEVRLIGWGLLVSIVFSEHLYFATQSIIRYCLSSFESPGLLKERREQFLVRKSYLKEIIGMDVDVAGSSINTQSLSAENATAPQNGKIGEAKSGLLKRQKNVESCIHAGLEIMKKHKTKSE